MKRIYIQPETDVVVLNTPKEILWGEEGLKGHSKDHAEGNQTSFFDDDMDDDHDPFFDD